MSTRRLARPHSVKTVTHSAPHPAHYQLGRIVRSFDILSVGSWALLVYCAVFAPATLEGYMYMAIVGSISKIGSMFLCRAWIGAQIKAARLDAYRVGRLSGAFEEAATIHGAAKSIKEGRNVL